MIEAQRRPQQGTHEWKFVPRDAAKKSASQRKRLARRLHARTFDGIVRLPGSIALNTHHRHHAQQKHEQLFAKAATTLGDVVFGRIETADFVELNLPPTIKAEATSIGRSLAYGSITMVAPMVAQAVVGSVLNGLGLSSVFAPALIASLMVAPNFAAAWYRGEFSHRVETVDSTTGNRRIQTQVHTQKIKEFSRQLIIGMTSAMTQAQLGQFTKMSQIFGGSTFLQGVFTNTVSNLGIRGIFGGMISGQVAETLKVGSIVNIQNANMQNAFLQQKLKEMIQHQKIVTEEARLQNIKSHRGLYAMRIGVSTLSAGMMYIWNKNPQSDIGQMVTGLFATDSGRNTMSFIVGQAVQTAKRDAQHIFRSMQLPTHPVTDELKAAKHTLEESLTQEIVEKTIQSKILEHLSGVRGVLSESVQQQIAQTFTQGLTHILSDQTTTISSAYDNMVQMSAAYTTQTAEILSQGTQSIQSMVAQLAATQITQTNIDLAAVQRGGQSVNLAHFSSDQSLDDRQYFELLMKDAMQINRIRELEILMHQQATAEMDSIWQSHWQQRETKGVNMDNIVQEQLAALKRIEQTSEVQLAVTQKVEQFMQTRQKEYTKEIKAAAHALEGSLLEFIIARNAQHLVARGNIADLDAEAVQNWVRNPYYVSSMLSTLNTLNVGVPSLLAVGINLATGGAAAVAEAGASTAASAAAASGGQGGGGGSSIVDAVTSQMRSRVPTRASAPVLSANLKNLHIRDVPAFTVASELALDQARRAISGEITRPSGLGSVLKETLTKTMEITRIRNAQAASVMQQLNTVGITNDEFKKFISSELHDEFETIRNVAERQNIPMADILTMSISQKVNGVEGLKAFGQVPLTQEQQELDEDFFDKLGTTTIETFSSEGKTSTTLKAPEFAEFAHNIHQFKEDAQTMRESKNVLDYVGDAADVYRFSTWARAGETLHNLFRMAPKQDIGTAYADLFAGRYSSGEIYRHVT